MKAKRLGRPKLAKGEAKGVLIGARFAPDEAQRVEAAVKRSGQVKSDWIRNTLLNAAK
jgi:hypothetical protein